jgi:DNA polymerase-3 subunit delta
VKASESADLADALEAIKAGKAPPVFLLVGDEYLCRTAIQELTQALVPEGLRSLNLVELDAGSGPRQVADEVATLPMFRGPKAVAVQPAEFIAPKKSARGDPFAKARELWDGARHKEAARRVLALAGRAGFALAGLEARSVADWKAAGFQLSAADLKVVSGAAELARSEGLEVPESDTRPLELLLERGVPAGHHLLLAADELDAKGALARLCLAQGMLLKRELPGQSAGFGKREAPDLRGLASEVLGPLGKSLAPEAERVLSHSAPTDARSLASELEKLATYVGSRAVIGIEDVRELVAEGGGEDLFAVANAIEARDKAGLIAAVDEELERGAVPLQILGSIAAAVRGLLAARARLGTLGLEKRFSFQEFERRAAPAFAEADKRAGRKVGHPFRAFKRAEAALRYSLRELAAGLDAVAKADAGIKRGMDARLWLVRIALQLGN